MSFDYLYEDEFCYMSMYIVVNVYGLMMLWVDDKKIMYYEFIGNYEYDFFLDILFLVEKCKLRIWENKNYKL